MKTLLTTSTFALLALVATDRAQAAPLNLVTADSPVIDVPVATADYLETGGIGDFSIFGAEGLASGTSQSGDLLLDVFFNFDTANPSDINGALFSIDDDGAFLDGTILQTGYDGEILELLFGNLSGTAASDFGDLARVDVVFLVPNPGTDPLSNLVDGTAYDVSATVSSVAPIPLPGALPLLIAGLGGLVLLRRRG
jgi:hypothetical protein